jgi:hypothetical protein
MHTARREPETMPFWSAVEDGAVWGSRILATRNDFSQLEFHVG